MYSLLAVLVFAASPVYSKAVSSVTVISVGVPAGSFDKATFTSPNYPRPYTSNLHIVYNITGPIGRAIEFNSEDFDLDFGAADPKDCLVFSEHLPGNRDTVTFGAFYRVKGPRKLRSVSNAVLATFTTDNNFYDSGFSITAVSAPAHPVVNVVVPETGSVTFTSPAYPAQYGHNLNVIYRFTGPTGRRIQFDAYDEFDLEPGSSDYLVISEGIPGRHEVILGTFYGESGPQRVRSKSNTVTAIFTTDFSAARTGFSIIASSII